MRGALAVGVMLAAAPLAADDRTILFDPDVKFAALRTFMLREGTVSSKRPELNSPLVVKRLTDGIRSALVARGLTEAAAPADLIVEFYVNSTDFDVGPFGRVNVAPGGRGRGGSPQPGSVDFTESVLVVDLSAGAPPALAWRGVYRAEDRAGKLSEALPKHAATLLSAYPPKAKD
jgi:hypothetical protein